jgi:hypothetical protein
MIISGLDKDIEFTLHEGDYTVEQCFDLIHKSSSSESYSSKKPILREIACNPRTAKSNFLPPLKNNIQNLFYQPVYLNNIAEGLIQTFDDFRKLMVVLISEKVQLFHPDSNYLYEIPIQPDHLGEFELIDTLFADNNEQFYNKLKKPVVPCAKLSMEGVEYL